MRVVADTNVLISALLWVGLPHRILEFAEEGNIQLYTSPPLVQELAEVLRRPKFSARLQALRVISDNLVAGYVRLAHLVLPKPIPPTILEDIADDAVLACACAAKAKYVISGDSHLLHVRSYEGILIVSPHAFFRKEEMRIQE
ncbi:MAG: putative toxin-antitoxin system toxin component, PIN family protein [Nitrospirales bacterium]|nr:MAG: putative toxin-antitoxin system toxin component, PIN family protein [Nitrospirales bacterium]